MLFDAVLFDLDGTLVATDSFWAPAARTGARAAFAQLGLDREPPSAAEWMSIVGDPFERGLARLFPDLDDEARACIGRACMAEEERRLEAGGAAPMPGALDVLRGLRERGVRVGIASNCAQGYLDHMLGELGLGEFVEEPRCLDTPGIRNKADMIADLLDVFGTRSAVFVGDRSTDRDAAWANGLPHVHCAFGFAAAGEAVEAEARIEDLGALPGVLEQRRSGLEDVLERAGCLAALAAASRPITVGVTGPSASGKTLFARDAAQAFRDRGVPALAVSLDRFRAAERGGAAPGPDEDPLGAGWDLERLSAEVLDPHAAGELADPDGAPADVLVLEGLFLVDPRLRRRLDRVLHLHASEELSLRRAAARVPRDAEGAGVEELLRLRRDDLPDQRRFFARLPPERHADLVLDGANPLCPRPAAPGLDRIQTEG